MLAAKRRFGFSSNKLAWLTAKLTKVKKLTHKKFPGFSLWESCLRDDPEAWAEMKLYNQVDVLATEELFLKLRGWIDNHPNMGAYAEADKPVCTKCGSERVHKRGLLVGSTGAYIRYHCQDCGGWNRSRQVVKRKKQLLAGG
jgi:hypothetical protein